VLSPSGSRAAHPVMAAGDVLAGRYRLLEPLRTARPDDVGQAELWRAVDEVLARPVAVTLVSAAGGQGQEAAQPLLAAAALAGALGRGPRGTAVLVQVYDAAVQEWPVDRTGHAAGSMDVAYVISEWIEGRSLAAALRTDGPLPAVEAGRLIAALAETLVEVHARGVVHGRLHPGNVLLPDGGGVRLTGTAVAAALHQSRLGAGRGPAGSSAAPSPADDVRDLAACLYAMLTARWPQSATPQPGGGLRPAPTTSGQLCSPAQVRAGAPRALGAVAMQALSPARVHAPPLRTAEAFAVALDRGVRAIPTSRPPATRVRRGPQPSSRRRRLLPVAAVVAFLSVIALGAYAAGTSLGTVRQDRSELQTLVDRTPPPAQPGGTGPAGQRLDLTAPGVRVTAFDPPPGDGVENPAAIPNAIDGDPATSWTTEAYSTERFGGLKSGVGLLVDLGQPVQVATVELGMRPGADVELRVGDTPAADASGFRVVATVNAAPTVTRLVPPEPVTARFFLVWLTKLPADGTRYRASIGELLLVRP